MNMNVGNESRPKRRNVWTTEDYEALRYWHACRYTDGRIAKKLGCCRRTVLRQRESIGLIAIVCEGRRSKANFAILKAAPAHQMSE